MVRQIRQMIYLISVSVYGKAITQCIIKQIQLQNHRKNPFPQHPAQPLSAEKGMKALSLSAGSHAACVIFAPECFAISM